MLCRVEVKPKLGLVDAPGARLAKDILDMGLRGVEAIATSQLFFFIGELFPETVHRIVSLLLIDPLTQDYTLNSTPPQHDHVIEVTTLPGVTDVLADSILLGIQTLCISGVQAVHTGQRYVIRGDLDQAGLQFIAERLLCNPLIQRYALGPIEPPIMAHSSFSYPPANTIPLRNATSQELLSLSQDGVLSLDLVEMQAIQAFYRTAGREPTDVELETLAQTWSEHCSHKSFKALVTYRGEPLPGRAEQEFTLDGLLAQTVMAATSRANRRWVLSAFKDNAGIIAFGPRHEVSFKVETHNHPSALEPFGGANTGVGGVIRDILGVSAKPIADTDVLCFGPLDLSYEQVPKGVLHPRRVYAGVVAGIQDYGNKMGVPTVNGSVLFDPGYTANPLVYCGTVGLAPRGSHPREARPGHLVVVIGGRAGRDGIHGATFSSAQLTADAGSILSSAVQIGNPIVEKKLTDVLLKARDLGLYSAVTDCGAGGLSSAVSEMCAETGARVHLERVPLKYQGLRPWEIWLSEAQERMVLAVPPEKAKRLLALCGSEDVEATVIGELTGDKRLHLLYGGETVGELPMEFLHQGMPQRRLGARWEHPADAASDLPEPEGLTPALLGILSNPDVASKESIIRRYDHEVQGNTVVKPLVGVANDGPSDAAVLKPLPSSYRGLVIANGINPLYGRLDPYWMAASAIDEAVRNCLTVGADPERIALLDNFCWGDPAKPEQMGGLVRACAACYDIAVAYRTPFISGKDSLNNEFHGRPIPPTLLISAIAVLPDIRRAVTMDAKRPTDLLYLLGLTYDELGGSHYLRWLGLEGGHVPQVRPRLARRLYRALYRAVKAGLVKACHDCSEGGLGVAAAEMAFAGGLGLEVSLTRALAVGVSRADAVLFSESNSRFLVEVAPEDVEVFESIFRGLPYACMGRFNEGNAFRVLAPDGHLVVETTLVTLKSTWQGTL